MRCRKHRRVACPDCKKAAVTADPYNDYGLWMTAQENQAILASGDTSAPWLESGSSDSGGSYGADSGSYSSSDSGS